MAASLGHHVKEATGWARLYASHYFCISCLAVLAQLGRQMPLVLFEVGCDDAWKSWEEREPNASYASWPAMRSEDRIARCPNPGLVLASTFPPRSRPAAFFFQIWKLGRLV
ncbi:unnamed protein product [Durusdinium trenchii]|uniref:Uncharacterized protein n=1 Tax=Durusdinium trenchii TaxID=1381693 RepID=A0ABP0R8K0_9DINO